MMTPLDPLLTLVARSLEYIGPRLTPPDNRETQAKLGDGLVLTLPPRLPSGRRLRSGTYEPDVTNVLHSIVMPGMTMVDVGANIGYYTLLGSRLVGDQGRVYAFEPDAEAYRYLEMNVKRGRVGNVTAVQAAVSDRTGSRAFVSNELERGFLSVALDSAPARTVTAVTLDDYFEDQGWPAVDVIKLDVEGAERSVLAGMGGLSAKNRGLRLVMEFNLDAIRRAGGTPHQLREALVQLGFRSGYVIELSTRPVSLSKPLPQTGLVCNLLLSKQ